MLITVLFLLLAVSVAPASAAVTSGLYLISSKYFLSDAISQDADGIWVEPADQGRLGQQWSVVVTGATATIQNVGTHAFFSVDTDGRTIVPSDKPYSWTITGDTPAAGIVTNGQQVYGWSEQFSLSLSDVGGSSTEMWNFVPILPSRAYRVWNQATNLYLDQVLGECAFPDSCILATAFNASSKSQVWNVDGWSACGGKPTLSNAASGAFLSSASDFTAVGIEAVLSGSPHPWTYGFVGGQLILLDKDGLEDIATLTVFGGRVDLSASGEGPGTGPNQTWVFRPV